MKGTVTKIRIITSKTNVTDLQAYAEEVKKDVIGSLSDVDPMDFIDEDEYGNYHSKVSIND